VLREMAGDTRTHADVAARLGIALTTVHQHAESLRLKLRAASARHAVAIALRTGLIT